MLVARADTFDQEPYLQDNPGRYQAWSGFKDCSGLIKASCDAEAAFEAELLQLLEPRDLMPATVSVTQFLWCRDNGGLVIPWELAVWVAGALLFCPEDPTLGWGNNGHVGFSRGDFTTREATPTKVQRLPANWQPWSKSQAVLIPGVWYPELGFGPKPEPIVIIPIKPPPPPDPNEGDDEMGLKLIKWKDEGGEHQDLIGITDDGSVFTTSGFEGKNYYIAGPKATADDERPRYQGRIKVGQVPAVIINDKEIRFRVQAEENGGALTVECYWRGSDTEGADHSRWGSYAVNP